MLNFREWVMEQYRNELWQSLIWGRMRNFRDLGGMGR